MAVATQTGVRAGGPAIALRPADVARLRGHAAAARRRATSSAATLASITVPVDPALDPTGIVARGRRVDEPWFTFEHPDAGRVVAGVGVAVALEARGPDRIARLDADWRALCAAAVGDAPAGHAAGPLAVGGMAFAPDGGGSPAWRGFAPASLHVPRVSLAGDAGGLSATLALAVGPDDDPDAAVDALLARVAALAPATTPLLDPDPARRPRVGSDRPPGHYEEAVARAVARIRRGELEKVVLAREVVTRGPVPDPAAVLGVLRDAFPSCFTFAVGRGRRTFLAASPELLARRDGRRVDTYGLAGSTRRSADPAVDDHLGERLLRSAKDREEHAIVVRRILERLGPVTAWTEAAEEPVVLRIANIQHLATPIRGELTGEDSLLELAGRLHPTPAVGGTPHELALRLIPELEDMDRGWYAGPVGWTDAAGDGELCVALRCALLDHGRAPSARLQAGVGVVADSDPADELAETETKLEAVLPILAG